MGIRDKTVFSQRLTMAIEDIGSIAEFCRITGLSRSAIENYLSGKSEPNLSRVRFISEKIGRSQTWLIGLESDSRAEGKASSLVPADELAKIADDPSFSLVPRYDVSASAGHGALVDQEAILGYMAFQTSWLRLTMGVNPDDLSLINAAGDSMEPTIRSGDLLLIDNSVNLLEDDGVYAIRVNEFLSVKRLQLNYEGGIEIRGDNPLYNTQTIDQSTADRIQIVGRVLWFGRRL